VPKLVPKVPSLPGASRRQQFSAATKEALIDVAEELFTEHGYASTSLDAIVSGAEVTKGALYHHFSGKQALFQAVSERVEARASEQIRRTIADQDDPWEKAEQGLQQFLRTVQEPAYRRLVIQDGPAVLGYERYREQEERSAFAVVLDLVREVFTERGLEVDEEMAATFGRLFFGALSSAGESVANADDPEAAAARVEIAVRFILAGLRSVTDSDDALESLAREREE